MFSFFIKKIVQFCLVTFFTITICFTVLYYSPSNAAHIQLGVNANQKDVASLTEKLHLNTSLPQQLYTYFKSLFKTDLGNSYITGAKVSSQIKDSFFYTFSLAIVSISLAVPLGVALGIFNTLKEHTVLKKILDLLFLLLLSIPSFWIAFLLILVFSLKLHWFPMIHQNNLQSFVLPCLSLVLVSFPSIARITFISLSKSKNQAYFIMAKTNGLSSKTLYLRYLLKNSLLPILTLGGIELGHFVSGTMVIETIFSFKGIGNLLTKALLQRDMPLIMGCILLITLSISMINFFLDLLYKKTYPYKESYDEV